MNFNSLRLSTRLFLAFGVIVLLSALTSGFAMMKLSAVQTNLEFIVTDGNVKIALNQTMSESVHIVSRVIGTIALLTDRNEKFEQQKKATAAREDYDKARAALEKFAASDSTRTARAEIDATATTARVANTQVMELGLAGKAAEATALLMTQAGPSTQKWQDALDKNINLQEERNKASYAAAQAEYASARTLLIGSAVASALLAIGLALLVVRSVVAELGGEPFEVAALAQSIADSDLTRPIHVRPGDTRSVLAGMARMQGSLASIVNGVRGNAESVATASAQIAQGNSDLSSRTEEQASALEETAASMEQLGSTVRQNADNAKQANQLAMGASTVAVEGGEVVAQVVDTMKGINDSSKKIVDIIGVIDGIAFQTNILALNAAVEAARAGEQGRGFAVVASEVRSLAQRSADAAKEIKSLITDSVERVERGTALVDRAGTTMHEVVTSIKRVTDIMGEISAASIEQSAGVAQVGEAVTQMDRATQQNSALVEESAAAAESLREQAQQLVKTVAVFKLAHAQARPAPPAQRVLMPVAPRASPPVARAVAAQERRGPNRATNVTRPAFGQPKPAVASATAATGASTDARTASDEWESF